jgi:hypothetical protein
MEPSRLLSEAEWEANHCWLVKENDYIANLEREIKCRINLNIKEKNPRANMESLTDALRAARALMEWNMDSGGSTYSVYGGFRTYRMNVYKIQEAAHDSAMSQPLYIINLTPTLPHQRVTLPTPLIHQLRRPLLPDHRQPNLKPLPLARLPPIDAPLERNKLGQEVQLLERGRLIPADMLMAQAVAAHSHDRRKRDLKFLARGRDAREQPGHLAVVGQREDELVNYTIAADGTGDQGERCVVRVREDEVVRVECR